MFIQTDQPTIGALRAIKAAHREGTLLVAAFDEIPEFVDLLKNGEIVASGMQQPYLMGVKSGEAPPPSARLSLISSRLTR